MSVTIEQLELEIQSKSTSAASGIDALTTSLSKLKNALRGGSGLNTVAKQVNDLDNAVNNMDVSQTAKVDKMVASLEKLKSLNGIKVSSSLSNQLKSLGEAAYSLVGVSFAPLRELGASLSPLASMDKAAGLASVNRELKKLPDSVAAIQGVNLDSLGEQVDKLTHKLTPLNNISKMSGLQSIVKSLQNVPIAAAGLNRVDWDGFNDDLVKLTNTLETFSQGLDKAGLSTGRFSNQLVKMSFQTGNANKSSDGIRKSFLNISAIGRTVTNAFKTTTDQIGSMVTLSNKYIEDINLFTISMGEYAGQAKEYAEQVGEVMGIDPGEFMRNQGIFNTIITGFGVASDKAYVMSQNLTQLGYDLSSFANISFEDSMQKLSSGISGELEPLRRLGYDLSVARLQEEALALGITKRVSAMTQAEKSQLRYHAIMTQVTIAQGDMGRTLNAPANQLRILKAQVLQASRALGNAFIPIINAVLPYLIALAKIVRLVAQSIASLFGFKMPDVDFGGVSAGASAAGELADNADDAAGGLGKAGKAAKKLKNALLGIDELNILSRDDDSAGGGSGGGGGGVGGGGGFDIPLPTYDFLGNAISSRVDDIIQKFKNWLGLTEDVKSVSDLLHTRLGRILTTVGAIGLGFAAWKISDALLSNVGLLSKLLTGGLGNKALISIGAGVTVTGIALEWSGIIDAITSQLNGMNFAQIVSGAFLTAGGGALLGKGIAGWITTSFADSAIAEALTTAATNLGLGSATAAGAAIGAAIGGIIAGVPMFFTGIYDAMKNGLNWLNGTLIPLGSTMAGAGIGAIIGSLGGPIGAGIGALIGLAVGLVTDGIVAVIQHWDEITSFLHKFFTETIPNMWEKFKQKVEKLPGEISQFFTKLWEPITNYDWYGLGKDLGLKFGKAIKSAIDFVTVKIPNWFSSTTRAIANTLTTFFTKTAPEFISKDLPQLFNKISKDFVEFFTKTLPKTLSDAKKWFVDVGKAIVDGVIEGFKTIPKAIDDFIKGFIDGVKEGLGIHSPSKVFAEIGKFCIDGLLNGLKDSVKNIGGWVKNTIITPIKNAFTNNPVVVAIKNNVPEMWEKAKTWWANETKDGLKVETLVKLTKDGWSTVSDWVGNIAPRKQAIGLKKEGWDTVSDWIGKIPAIDQTIELAKSGWSSVKEWVGDIPSLSQRIHLIKQGWDTVNNWVGHIPTLSQAIALIKSGWDSVQGWIGQLPVIGQYISLEKKGWSSVRDWIGTSTIDIKVNLIKGAWDAVTNGISNLTDGLNHKSTTSDGDPVRSNRTKKLKKAATGAVITANSWKAMPKYAGGTNRAHGSMFVAGESGAELVGHVNGRTEVINRFQLGAIMLESIVSGMSQFGGYWRTMSRDMVTSANAVINAINVNAAEINENMVLASATGFDPGKSLANSVYENTARSRDGIDADDAFYRNMRDFYHEYLEPTLKDIANDTKRQADKHEQTVVKIGNRTVTDAVTTQKDADGYRFTD